MNNKQGIQLTVGGVAKFDKWVSTIGAPSLNTQAVFSEALERFEDDILLGQDPSYELDSQSTTTGRPEVFRLKPEDFTFAPYVD